MASIGEYNGKWRAQVYRRGIRESKVFATKTLAKRWAARREFELDQDAAPDGSMIFSDVLARYVEEVSPKKRGYDWERKKVRNFRDDKISEKPIRDIKPADIADWRDRRLALVMASTVNREMNLLSHVFHTSRKEWGMIATSPMTDVSRPKEGPPRSRVTTEHEMEAMTLVAGRDYTSITARAFAAFLFACETAMRAGEIAGLSSETVNYATRVAHLPETKNGKERHVPLSSKAVCILQAMPDQDLLFNLTSEKISTGFMRLRKRAGVSGLTFHDSRRIGTTRLSKKLEVLDLARATGHTDIRILLETYYRPDAEAMAKMLD